MSLEVFSVHVSDVALVYISCVGGFGGAAKWRPIKSTATVEWYASRGGISTGSQLVS